MSSIKKQLNLLRALEENDLLLKDLTSPDYKKIGFKTPKLTLDVIQAIETKREEIAEKIEPNLLTAYKKIMKRYGGRVVVQVINEFCGGCFMKLPSEYVYRCRTEIVNCPNCGRFLYWVK